MAGVGLALARDRVCENSLNLDRIFKLLGIKSESAAYPNTMCIRYNAGDSENIAEQEICDLSSDTGKLTKLMNVARQFAIIFIAKLDTSRFDRCRLGAVKSAGADYIFYILKRSICEVGKSRVFEEQIFANDIYTRIGALGGKSAHNHQLPSLFPSPIKRASGIGI